MTESIHITAKEAATVARAGLRASMAHARYATDVQLAFGRHAQSDKIVHVSKVERGRQCGCFCPACSEELVAKQGEVLAWHFAHASGATCKEALSASFAAWLAQELSEGRGLRLPPVSFVYGTSRIEVAGPVAPVVFSRALAYQPSQGKPFEVLAMVDTVNGVQNVRIIIQIIDKIVLPTVEEARLGGDAVLCLDLRASLRQFLSSREDVVLEEAWLSDTLLDKGERVWIWAPKADRALSKHIASRLAPLVHPKRPAPVGFVAIQESLALTGLDKALMLEKVVEGEAGLVYEPFVWRALFLYDRFFVPLQGSGEKTLMSVGFSRKEMGSWLRFRSVDPLNFTQSRAMTNDDWLEAWRRYKAKSAMTVLESYVELLWRNGFVARKPVRGILPNQGPMDPRLALPGMPFWRPSDTVFSIMEKCKKPI